MAPMHAVRHTYDRQSRKLRRSCAAGPAQVAFLNEALIRASTAKNNRIIKQTTSPCPEQPSPGSTGACKSLGCCSYGDGSQDKELDKWKTNTKISLRDKRMVSGMEWWRKCEKENVHFFYSSHSGDCDFTLWDHQIGWTKRRKLSTSPTITPRDRVARDFLLRLTPFF